MGANTEVTSAQYFAVVLELRDRKSLGVAVVARLADSIAKNELATEPA